MRNNHFLKFKKLSVKHYIWGNQKGVSLIITFFIMIIILAVVLGITTLLYSEIKMIRNIGNSIVAFYSADSGIEKVLYYDRQIIPAGASRGLCAMLSYDPINNPQACPDSDSGLGLDSGIYCNNPSTQLTDTENPDGCNPSICNGCIVSFDTILPDNEKKYSVEATVTPAEEGYTGLTIGSLGEFRGVKRKIQLYMEKVESSELIRIKNIYVIGSYYDGGGMKISVAVELEASNGVSFIEAHIKDSPEGEDVVGSPINLILSSGTIFDGTFAGIWDGSEGSYYVDLIIVDTLGERLEVNNIEPDFL